MAGAEISPLLPGRESARRMDYFAKRRNRSDLKLRTNGRVLERRAAVFKALGHADRLRIVEEVAEGERCVCDLVEAIGSS